jgi:hypothetical protein
MSEVKHTPGPWWVTDHGVRDVGGYVAHTKNAQRYEGQDERYAREVAQREADKLLIAAAPELLDELITCRHDLARQAAELRESVTVHHAIPDEDDEALCQFEESRIARLDALIAKATGAPA